MEKFTKSHWKVAQGHYPSMKEISGPSFTINCVMWATDLTESDYIKRSADLALIAAAPDMYRLLSFIADVQKKNYGDGMMLHLDMIGVAEKINALLAKARGE